MSAATRPMTVDEFLDWEERQELKYEFDGFAPIAMTGGTFAHTEIATNIVVALRERLAGSPRRAIRGDLKIRTRAGLRIRYPDVIVVCSPIGRSDKFAPDPVIVFEVLSESTAREDRFRKNEEYAGIAAIRRYVIVEQEFRGATVFSRSDAGWIGQLVMGAGAVLPLPEIDADLTFDAIYAGLDVPEADAEDETTVAPGHAA